MSAVWRLYVQALVIVGLPYILRSVFNLRRIVPLVVVQLLLGILLGPTLLGQMYPEFSHYLFDVPALSSLSGISSISVLLFAFITGLRLDGASFRKNTLSLTIIGLGSVFVPLITGALAGLWIGRRFPTEVGADTNLLPFAVGVGICISVTALPVLAAILRETGLINQKIGQAALALAAMNDMVLWIVLAVVLCWSHPADGNASLLRLVLLAPAAALLIKLAGTTLKWVWCRSSSMGEDGFLAASCVYAILAAMLTDAAGMHSLIGAFVAGVVTPDEIRRPILDRLEPVTAVVLLPFFFMTTGLRTHVEPWSNSFVEIFLVTTITATGSKLLGTAVLARRTGETWAFSFGLGALMQTKGLMEVVAATILLDAHVISVNVFSATILMALSTTAFAIPLANLALRASLRATRSVHGDRNLPQM